MLKVTHHHNVMLPRVINNALIHLQFTPECNLAYNGIFFKSAKEKDKNKLYRTLQAQSLNKTIA